MERVGQKIDEPGSKAVSNIQIDNHYCVLPVVPKVLFDCETFSSALSFTSPDSLNDFKLKQNGWSAIDITCRREE